MTKIKSQHQIIEENFGDIKEECIEEYVRLIDCGVKNRHNYLAAERAAYCNAIRKFRALKDNVDERW